MQSDRGARCEPDAASRDRDGWHWIVADEANARPFIDRWYSPSGSHGGFFDIAGEPPWFGRGYRYLFPVPSPGELAALVRAGRRVLEPNWNGQMTRTRDQHLALALAPFSSIPDAEPGA